LPQTSARYRALLPNADSIIEISPESLTTTADFATRIGGTARSPKEPSGAALILDYGPSATIPTNSLRGIKAHTQCSPFALPGQVDISADVDFMGLAEAAVNASEGVEVHGPVEQALFLSAMGIKERAGALKKRAGGEKDVERIEGAWTRLVDRGPTGMGRIYKALAILPHLPGKTDGKVRRPVGFGGDIVA
jgi:NADH dehydrogenase [ubiquinone] 1 alpha subcomplex assembly factor 7